jgi:hypothetical protein
MRQSGRGMIAGIIVAGVVMLLFGKSGSVGAQHAGGISHWVKVGKYHINGDNIDYTEDADGGLNIVFSDHYFSLKGAEARAYAPLFSGI